jgi:hypothetical protein
LSGYRNKFEKYTGTRLESMGVDFSYESSKVPYTVSGNYIPDFAITSKSGNVILVETKGNGRSFDGHSRRKLVAVKEQHPELDLRIVFYGDGNIGPKRKDGTRMKQLEWASRHGFKVAVKDIPKEWLNE